MTTTSILGKTKLSLLLDVARKARISAPGDAVELGIYRGGVLWDLARLFTPPSTVWGYDSFTGLPPEDWSEDEVHQAGDFRDTSLSAVRRLCAPYPNIRLIPGHIPESLIDARFAFAHVDLDFYSSTRAALKWLIPRMNAGGAVVLDDVDWPRCPGVRRALDESGMEYEKLGEYQAVIWMRPCKLAA